MRAPPAHLHPAARTLVDVFHARQPIRTGSLVVTIYGDCVAPRGGSLALATLLHLTEAMRIGDGVVRTAVSRLATEGWLLRLRTGRSAFYRLTERARADCGHAAARIYATGPGAWSGRWEVLTHLGEAARRTAWRERLEAAGYGVLAPHVLLRPATAQPEQTNPSEATGGAISEGEVYRLIGTGKSGSGARALAAAAWPLERVAQGYRRLLATIELPARQLLATPELDPLSAMVARILVIHEYRRIILHDPLLPVPLLPEEWPGGRAGELLATLYPALLTRAESWLDERGTNEGGALPPPDRSMHARFADARP